MFLKSNVHIFLGAVLVAMTLTSSIGAYSVKVEEKLIDNIDITDKIKHRRISNNNSSMAVLKDDGSVWGIVNCEIIEDGNSSDIVPSDYKPDVLKKIEGLENIVSLAGEFTYLALDKEGDIWEFEETYYAFSEPKKVEGISNAAGVFVDRGMHIAVEKDGTAWIWGEKYERYGYEDEETIVNPERIEWFDGIVNLYPGIFLTYEEDVHIFAQKGGVNVFSKVYEFYKIDDETNIKDIYIDGVLKNDETVWGIHGSAFEMFFKQEEELLDISSMSSHISSVAIDTNGDVWNKEYQNEAMLDIDKDIVRWEVWEDELNEYYNPIDEFKIRETKKIINNIGVKEAYMGSNRMGIITDEGRVMYVGRSFEPITDYDRNNIDFEIPSYVKTSEEFNEDDVSIYKIQNVPKELKYEDGTVFNIHE